MELVGFGVNATSEFTKIYDKSWQLLELAGQMIVCWTSTREFNQASKLLRALSQALFFFWSGCTDDEDLMSIVKFTACLEALSPDQNENGVVNLLKCRLGMKESDFVTKDKTLKQLVKKMYKNARSRTLHGTNHNLMRDWSIVKIHSEMVTRQCLVSSMIYLVENPNEQDRSCLLKPNR